MVRANTKQTATQDDDKKESRKKKSSSKAKKVSEAGVWPCKMNGCNKQFAREADLKRHQRTTKSHSMPGFACPQCDATFTRTDALRRHQKSRHNGVIIEPVDANKGEDGEEGGSSGSKDGSRSGSPNAKGKGKGKSKKHDPDAPTALANPGTAGPASGPSSYYRQHTMQNGVMMDASQQFQNGGPRLHQSNWPPPPPWAAEGSQAQMGTISYQPSQPGYYQPSPYYRQNGPPMGAAPVMQQTFPAQPQEMQQAPDAPIDPSSQELGDEDAHGDVEMVEDDTPDPTAPVIDPSLDASTSTPNPQAQGPGNAVGVNQQGGQSTTPAPSLSTKPVSLEITQAAMQAVLQSSRASGTPDQGMHSHNSSSNGHLIAPSANTTQESVPEAQALRPITTAKSPFAHQSPIPQPQALPQALPILEPVQSQVQSQAAVAQPMPMPMEPMLTEDGEPMLNPAELLTQVGPILSDGSMGALLDMLLAQDSLASPPPS